MPRNFTKIQFIRPLSLSSISSFVSVYLDTHPFKFISTLFIYS
jgi:hypothetical protein